MREKGRRRCWKKRRRKLERIKKKRKGKKGR